MIERIGEYRKLTPEHRLSSFYDPETYARLRPRVMERVSAVGILTTDERCVAEHLGIHPEPNGYIIGTGNSSIWTMIDLFPQNTLPKGVFSIDRDPSVILSGKVLVELAKRDISAEEVTSYFYGTVMQGGSAYTINDLLDVAREVVEREPNLFLKRILQETIKNNHFFYDMKLLRNLESNPTMPDKRRRQPMTNALIRLWPTIVQLAKEGKIYFIHSDVGNEETLQFIASQIPDTRSLHNILYVSNLADQKYERCLNHWEIFNQSGGSWYISTSEVNYALRASHKPPAPSYEYHYPYV